MVLLAQLVEMRCPTSSPPTADTFAMVVPLAAPTAAARVLLKRDGADARAELDVQVEVAPVRFEYRNASLLHAIDYIERSIKAPLGRAAPRRPAGAPAKPQPRWAVRVAHAEMRMPAHAEEGALDFIVDDAYVGNKVLAQPVLTDLITVRAHNVRGHAFRPGAGRSSLPLLEALPKIELLLRKPVRRAEGAAVGMAFIGLEIEESEHTLHLGLQPDDIRLLVALWLDNLSRNFKPPKDRAKTPPPPETVALSVHVNASQAAAPQPATHGPPAPSCLHHPYPYPAYHPHPMHPLLSAAGDANHPNPAARMCIIPLREHTARATARAQRTRTAKRVPHAPHARPTHAPGGHLAARARDGAADAAPASAATGRQRRQEPGGRDQGQDRRGRHARARRHAPARRGGGGAAAAVDADPRAGAAQLRGGGAGARRHAGHVRAAPGRLARGAGRRGGRPGYQPAQGQAEPGQDHREHRPERDRGGGHRRRPAGRRAAARARAVPRRLRGARGGEHARAHASAQARRRLAQGAARARRGELLAAVRAAAHRPPRAARRAWPRGRPGGGAARPVRGGLRPSGAAVHPRRRRRRGGARRGEGEPLPPAVAARAAGRRRRAALAADVGQRGARQAAATARDAPAGDGRGHEARRRRGRH